MMYEVIFKDGRIVRKMMTQMQRRDCIKNGAIAIRKISKIK